MRRDEPEVTAARLRRARNVDLAGPLELKAPVVVGTVIQLWRDGKVVGRSTLKAPGGAIVGDTINLRWHSDGQTVAVKVVA